MDSAKRCTRLKKNFYIIKYIIYKKKVHSIFLKIFIKPKFLPEPKFRKEKTIFFCIGYFCVKSFSFMAFTSWKTTRRWSWLWVWIIHFLLGRMFLLLLFSFQTFSYKVNPLTGYIDYDKLLRIIDYDKCAGSSYLRELWEV
jgi:hypothetical protein